MKNKLLRLVPLIFFLSLIGLNAATINVPDSVGTLQAAVDSATAGDTINIQGSYTHNGLLTTIDKDLTITGNNQSIDGGFDITGGAVVEINDLTITGIQTSGTKVGWSSHSTAGATGAKYVISVIDGSLTSDNLTIDQSYPNEGSMTGINVRALGTLDLDNSELTLSTQRYVYGIYMQRTATPDVATVSVDNTEFNGEILTTTLSNRRIIFIGFEIDNDDLFPSITHSGNTYNTTFSDSDQRFYEFSLYDNGSSLSPAQLNTFLDGILTVGEYAYVWYISQGGWFIYGLENIVENATPGDTINLEPGDYFAIEINTENVTLVGTAGVYIYNGSPAITINANDITLDGLSFNFDSADYAIDVNGDYSGIVVKNCTFDNTDGGGSNPGFGIDNDNGGPYYVNATENNDWGDPSGPTHASNPGGSGVTITDYVIYEWDGLVAPVHSVSGVSVTPTFEWDTVPTTPPASYRLIISENSDLSSPIYSKNLGTDTTYTIADTAANFPLDNNSQYYWSVDVLDEEDNKVIQPDTNYFYTLDDLTISVGHPGDGSSVYLYDPLQFSWYLSQAQGSIRFLLQIKDSSAAPGPAGWLNYADFEYDHIGSTFRSVNGLSGGTRYYWRIIAYYDDGTGSTGSFDWLDRVVKISNEYYFDTQGGAVKAYPSWPIGGNTIYTLSPTFYWYTLQYESSVTYEVYYSTSSSTTGGILDTYTDISAGSNTYVSLGTDLAPSTTYYWQVKTTYTATGDVNYSSVASFTTYDAPGLVPTAATPSYPAGGITIYTQSPTFYWYIEGYNVDVNFTVELSTDGFGTIAHSFGTTQSLYIQGSGLTPGITYEWRVRASKSGYTDVLGPTATFTLAGGASSSVVLSWPVGNPTVWSNTPTLSWYLDGSSLGWDHYEVRWKKGSTSSDWASDYDDSYSTSSMNETSFTMTTPLEYGETYYWAVALHDGTTPPIDARYVESSFTIAGGNAVVVQTNPANNSTGISKNPTFYWYVSSGSQGINKYMVEYSKTELFTAFVDSVESTSTYATVSSSLEAGATYWWRVYVSYDAGASWSLASSTWKFTIDAGASAVMPLVGSPANGVTISDNSPVLSWYLPTQSESTLSYEVEVADNPEFANVEVYDNISQLNAQVSELEEGEYYWRVRSKADGSTSSYSNTGNFKVGDGVTSLEDEDMPLTYDIDQNYPNPFNPTTTINYAIPEANYVSIKIYNMLGQEVKTLVNKDVKAGRHTIEWRGENNYGQKVSSGTYIYRITAGEYTQAKKMILLK